MSVIETEGPLESSQDFVNILLLSQLISAYNLKLYPVKICFNIILHFIPI
jgi:hypothetical protein